MPHQNPSRPRDAASPGEDRAAQAPDRPQTRSRADAAARGDADRAAHAGHVEHARRSGRWGAEEPPYGRPAGERPNSGQGGRPNPRGPEYEQGGRYPGAREPGEGRSAAGETGATPKPGEGRQRRG